MKVVDVFGYFPEIYKVSPTPHLEFFQYAIEEDRMYVNHTVDSLIYVYQLPDKPLYTIGYECKDIDRDYTVSRKIDNSTLFEKDLQHVGFNTWLRFIPGSDVLCRTYIKSAKTGSPACKYIRATILWRMLTSLRFSIFWDILTDTTMEAVISR